MDIHQGGFEPMDEDSHSPAISNPAAVSQAPPPPQQHQQPHLSNQHFNTNDGGKRQKKYKNPAIHSTATGRIARTAPKNNARKSAKESVTRAHVDLTTPDLLEHHQTPGQIQTYIDSPQDSFSDSSQTDSQQGLPMNLSFHQPEFVSSSPFQLPSHPHHQENSQMTGYQDNGAPQFQYMEPQQQPFYHQPNPYQHSTHQQSLPQQQTPAVAFAGEIGSHEHLPPSIPPMPAPLQIPVPVSLSMPAPYQQTPPTVATNANTPSSSVSLNHRTPDPAPMSGVLHYTPDGYIKFASQQVEIEELDPEFLISLFRSPSDILPPLNPLASHPMEVLGELIRRLPPPDHRGRLRDCFFRVFSPLFHIVHEPSFHITYDQFRRDPSSVSLTDLALLFVVFAISAMTLPDDDVLLVNVPYDSSFTPKNKILAGRYQSAAIDALTADRFMERHNLTTIKTLVLLIYSFSHTRGAAWSLLGATISIATAIGCHIDPIHLTNVTPVEAEERRRCWAALMMLRTIQGTCLGVLVPLKVSANIDMPSDIEDEDINQVARAETPPGRTTSKMTYILMKFKLYQLASQLCKIPPLGPKTNYFQVLHYDRRIEQEMHALRTKFGNWTSLPAYHQAQYYILNIYTNQLFLILHRQYLYPRMDIPDKIRDLCLRRCITSSAEIIKSYEYLSIHYHQYLWYVQSLGAFYALLAAICLVVTVNHTMLCNAPYLPVLTQLRRLYHIFDKLGHRSDLCKRGRRFLLETLPQDFSPDELWLDPLEYGMTDPFDEKMRRQNPFNAREGIILPTPGYYNIDDPTVPPQEQLEYVDHSLIKEMMRRRPRKPTSTATPGAVSTSSQGSNSKESSRRGSSSKGSSSRGSGSQASSSQASNSKEMSDNAKGKRPQMFRASSSAELFVARSKPVEWLSPGSFAWQDWSFVRMG